MTHCTPTPSLRRLTLAVALPLAAAGTLLVGAPPSPAVAAPVTVEESEICQYSFDQYWRRLPVELTGELYNLTTAQPIAPGGAAAPGDVIQLRAVTFTAELPPWMLTFGFDSEFLPAGEGETPISGWIAFEATNTQQGIQAPAPFSTVARSTIVVGPGGVVDEVSSTFPIDPATVAVPTWTATGGPVDVRQAIGTRMGKIPAGRDGALIDVNGSLFTETSIGSGPNVTRLFLDCTVGDQLQEGAAHTDRTPQAVGGTVRVPNFAGDVVGGPSAGSLADPVDLAVVDRSLPRARSGQAATLATTALELRLDAAQRAAWLGSGGTASFSGAVTLQADRGAPASQEAAIVSTAPVAVPASGPMTLTLNLASTTWTAQGDQGIDVRFADAVDVVATVAGVPRTLRLERAAASTALRATAYPFAFVLGPDPRTRFEDDNRGGGGGGGGGGSDDPVSPTNPPPLGGGGGGFAPPPVKRGKETTVKIASSTLRRKSGKLAIKLTNLSGTASTKGRFTLVTTAKHRVGKSNRKQLVPLIARSSYSLAAGKSRTYTVKLGKAATTLLKSRSSVKAKLTVTPSSSTTESVVSRTVTVRR